MYSVIDSQKTSTQTCGAQPIREDLASFAHRTRLTYAINGNVTGLYWFVSLQYPVQESDLLEAVKVGRVKCLTDILCVYLERGVPVSVAAVEALARRWVESAMRGIDFPGIEVTILLETYLSPAFFEKAKAAIVRTLGTSPVAVRSKLIRYASMLMPEAIDSGERLAAA